MSQNEQTYSRAITAALIGLATQAVLAIAVGLLSLYTQSPALNVATWYILGGLPIWVVIWALFNQHRLERQEALEAEALAADDARAAALFNEAGQQLAIARRGLERIYKYGLNIVSLLVGVYLTTLGALFFYFSLNANRTIYQAEGLAAEAGLTTGLGINPGANLVLLMLALVVLGFASFLVARYVAGMTTEKAWIPLRGGAAYLMGSAVVIALLLVAAVFAYFNEPRGFVYGSVVISAVMTLLGVETLLAFLFGIYRPRKTGEFVRPAFDSRILGWLTRPESIGKIVTETLNYQFGFEISRSWFYQLLARLTLPLVVVGVVVLLLMSSLVFVAPQQNAIITTFGAFDRVAQPGLHFKWPWPVGRAQKYDVYRVHQIILGSRYEDFMEGIALLWTNQHTETDETYLVTAPTPTSDDDDQLITDIAAGELIGCDVVVKYRIAEGGLKQYATSAVDPVKYLEAVAEQVINRYFATKDIDTLLGTGRLDASQTLLQQIRDEANRVQLGIEVAFVTVSVVHPPQKSEVAMKFHEQIGASQEKLAAIEDARREAESILASVAGSREKALQIQNAIDAVNDLQARVDADPNDEATRQQLLDASAKVEQLIDAAGGEAAQQLAAARAFRWEHAISELARTERFRSELAAYQNAPRYYKMQLYLEALAEALKDRRKVIIDSRSDHSPHIRLQLEDASSGLDRLFQEDQ